jgi:hypothetical protein
MEQYLGQKWGIGVTNTTVAPGRYLIPTNRPFYPTDIGGCSLWLDAADASTVTGTSSVTEWRDKSGNGYSFTKASYSGGTITLSSRNGNSTVNLANNVMTTASFPWTRWNTMFFVVSTNNEWLYSLGNLTNYFGTGNWQLFANGEIFQDANVSQGNELLAALGLTNQYCLLVIGYGGGTQASNYTVNGTVRFTTQGTSTGNGTINPGSPLPQSTTTAPLWLNGSYQYHYATSTYVAEIVHYNNELTTSQRQQVEGYLAWKWGLVANLPPATSHLGKLLPAFSTNFTPKSLTGMRWWVDGMDTSTMTFSSGSNITQWRDKSGNAYHATGVNSPQKLSSGGVSFNAASSRYFTMDVPYSTTNTVFMVASPVPSTTSGMYYMNTSSPGNRGTIYLGGNLTAYITYYMGTNNPEITVIRTDLPTTPFLVSSIKTAGVTNVGFYNGAQAFSVVDNATINANSWGFLGGASATDNLLTATIYEMVIFSRALTSSERQQVEGHLAWKWGLQSNLPSTHAYAKFAP